MAPSNQLVLDLLEQSSSGLRHAICALLSVIASTAKGVDYLTQAGMQIVEKVIKILKNEQSPTTAGTAAAATATGDAKQ